LLIDRFNTVSLPLYVILKPQANGEFEEVARFEGRINDVHDFEDLLRSPAERARAQANQGQ
jgi:hypothetical protein